MALNIWFGSLSVCKARCPTAGIREDVQSGSAATAHAPAPAFTCSVPAVSTGLRLPQRREMRTDFQSREFKCAKL